LECVHGLWGNLNDGRVGGYFQPRANTGASLTATWSNITFAPCVNVGELALRPDKLNRKSPGAFVTAFIEPPPGGSASDIDVGSLLLNGVVAPTAGAPTSIGDFDQDGIPDLMVKFGLGGLLGTVPNGTSTVTLTGLI